jgi:hypothetical protein
MTAFRPPGPLPFADPLQERQEPPVKRQIQDVARWLPDRRRGALTKAFFPVSSSDLGQEPGLCAPQAQLGLRWTACGR